ncbi:MAG: TGS domain-containing protein, partial [Patescibacteria group bacterium]
IFAFTPKGEVKDLPDGATPIDFSYAIHTELGHMTRGAKINGKMVPLHYELKNGDVVEIIKGKNKKPSFDWLKIVKTAEAKKKIKSYFNDRPSADIERPAAEVDIALSRRYKSLKSNRKIVSTKDNLGTGTILIQGQKGFLYKLAKCCNPTTEHKIKGYLTVNRGVSIHIATCSNVKNSASTRLLNASWSDRKK